MRITAYVIAAAVLLLGFLVMSEKSYNRGYSKCEADISGSVSSENLDKLMRALDK